MEIFSDHVIEEELYRTKLKQKDLQQKIARLDEAEKFSEQQELKQYRKMCFGALSFFTCQLTLGYHAIYNVEWLGWDIVEPLTYTVSQGLMIAGLFWILRVNNRQ